MLGNPEFFTIKQLQEASMWPLEYLSFYGMAPYIKRIKNKKVIGIEIGVLKGDNVCLLLQECPNIHKLYAIDPYITHKDYDTHRSQEDMDNFKKTAIDNFKDFGDRVELIEKTSIEAATQFEQESIDFVLIDGDHSIEGIKSDLKLYYPLLKKGGYVFIHDCNMPTVRQGIKEFKDENKVRIPVSTSKNFVCFWIKA